MIILYNAANGAVLSPTNRNLSVVIMANDNAYGRIGFANYSIHKYLIEQDHDVAFNLEVVREFGTNRAVTVWYNVTKVIGDKTMDEIYPAYGKFIIAAGEINHFLTLYLTGDQKPEMKEDFLVR